MEAGDAEFVHLDPWPDEEHGSAGGADEIGQHGTDEEVERVHQRRGLAFDADVDAAGDDEEGTDEGHEADVLMRGVVQRVPVVLDEGIIRGGD